MKKIKTTIVIVAAIAAMAVSVWGDRQLDARYSDAGTTPVGMSVCTETSDLLAILEAAQTWPFADPSKRLFAFYALAWRKKAASRAERSWGLGCVISRWERSINRMVSQKLLTKSRLWVESRMRPPASPWARR